MFGLFGNSEPDCYIVAQINGQSEPVSFGVNSSMSGWTDESMKQYVARYYRWEDIQSVRMSNRPA